MVEELPHNSELYWSAWRRVFAAFETPFAYTFLVLHSESENEIAKLTKASSNSLAEEGKGRS